MTVLGPVAEDEPESGLAVGAARLLVGTRALRLNWACSLGGEGSRRAGWARLTHALLRLGGSRPSGHAWGLRLRTLAIFGGRCLALEGVVLRERHVVSKCGSWKTRACWDLKDWSARREMRKQNQKEC